MTDDRAQTLAARVAGIASRHPCVGLAVAVVRDGAARFLQHGLADIAGGTPVCEDTVFQIGSVTKTMTAVAVMQLCERGLIDLDAPAGDYLRAYRLVPDRDHYRPVTVRHLLTHTAGIQEVWRPSGLLRPRDLGETVPHGRPVPSPARRICSGRRPVAGSTRGAAWPPSCARRRPRPWSVTNGGTRGAGGRASTRTRQW